MTDVSSKRNIIEAQKKLFIGSSEWLLLMLMLFNPDLDSYLNMLTNGMLFVF